MKPFGNHAVVSPRALARLAAREYTSRGFIVTGTLIRTDGSIVVQFMEPPTHGVTEAQILEEMGSS